MSTLPQPRDPAEAGAVVSIVVDGLRRLEDSVARGFAEINAAMIRLPNDYVPRREVERRLDELTFDVAGERVERKADVLRLEGCIDTVQAEARAAELRREQVEREAAKERRTAHRSILAVGAATAASAIGTGIGVYLHFH